MWLTLIIYGCNHVGFMRRTQLWTQNLTVDRTGRDYSKDLYIPAVNLALRLSFLSCFLVDL